MDIIVTETHTRMALAVVRELGRAGYRVISVTSEAKASLGHSSRYAEKRITLPESRYTDSLLELGGDTRPVLLPTGMRTLNEAAARRGEFLSAFRMLLPGKEALEMAGDKPSVASAARETGLLTPREYPLQEPQFPCVIKYRNGEALSLPAKHRYVIVRQERDYEKALLAMQAKGEVFVTQYISGSAYGVSAVLNEDSEPLRVFCHKRVREYPAAGGPACCAESVWYPKLAEAGLKLLKAVGLVGFAMVEFKGTPDNVYVLEINPRIWGTYPLSWRSDARMSVAYARGATLEESSREQAVDKEPHYKQGVRMQYLVNDIMRSAELARSGKLDGSAFKDMLSPGVTGGVFDPADFGGTFAYISALFKKRGRGN